MSDAAEDGGELVDRFFVDESGTPDLFAGKGRNKRCLLGEPNQSNFFLLGKLRVDDPEGLAAAFENLRAELTADPWFHGVPSFDPARNRTAVSFHATYDLPEVRREVFRLLRERGDRLRFYAVVRDKHAVRDEVRERNAADPAYRYRPWALYDDLVTDLFRKLHGGTPDRIEVCIAARGRKKRLRELRSAFDRAAERFQGGFGLAPIPTDVDVRPSADVAGLQAVDYFLWAVQRFYEFGDSQALRYLWPQFGELHDHDLPHARQRGGAGLARGRYFRRGQACPDLTSRPLPHRRRAEPGGG